MLYLPFTSLYSHVCGCAIKQSINHSIEPAWRPQPVSAKSVSSRPCAVAVINEVMWVCCRASRACAVDAAPAGRLCPRGCTSCRPIMAALGSLPVVNKPVISLAETGHVSSELESKSAGPSSDERRMSVAINFCLSFGFRLEFSRTSDRCVSAQTTAGITTCTHAYYARPRTVFLSFLGPSLNFFAMHYSIPYSIFY